jgi:hypothetical protein
LPLAFAATTTTADRDDDDDGGSFGVRGRHLRRT